MGKKAAAVGSRFLPHNSDYHYCVDSYELIFWDNLLFGTP